MSILNLEKEKCTLHARFFSFRYFLLDTGALRLPFRGLSFSVGYFVY